MASTNLDKLFNEIEFNERRLLLLLSKDLLWFRKNLEHQSSRKNKVAFLKKKTEKYNNVFETTRELAELQNKILKQESSSVNPYVFVAQERLESQKVKIKSPEKSKKVSKPQLFEVIAFTHFVDIFNNPRLRKCSKQKCIELVQKQILSRENNTTSSKYAREYYINHKTEADKIINNLFVDSALYLKRDIETEIKAKNLKKQKEQEAALEAHKKLIREKRLEKERREKLNQVKQEQQEKRALNIANKEQNITEKPKRIRTIASTRFNSKTNTQETVYFNVHENQDENTL